MVWDGSLPLCIPVKRSLRTVSSYIWPNSSKIGLRSFSSKLRGIWPTKSLMASWSFIGMVCDSDVGPFGICDASSSIGPLASAAILVYTRRQKMKFARASYLHTSIAPIMHPSFLAIIEFLFRACQPLPIDDCWAHPIRQQTATHSQKERKNLPDMAKLRITH